jgi:hypothetical protein
LFHFSICVVHVYIVLFFFLSFKTQKERRKKNREERAIVADWPIEKRLSNIDAFFHWFLLSIGERLTAEREKKREKTDTYTQQEDNCTRRK